jgi:16S rRNA (guanine527-N7)-methyltransferase
MTHSVSEGQSKKLKEFQALFLRWNQSINLSAARSDAEVDVHIRDSLHLVPHLLTVSRALDVGSGGGFPVVIAAICLPETHFTALEPVHKKHAFLRTVARDLELPNFDPLAIRLEDHSVHDYDAATSRATLDLRDWLLLGLQHVRMGGLVIGFEATPRADLPEPFERHAYDLDGKQRALVIVKRV